MQHLNWDDFRILLALARAESLKGAARLLTLNATTVSRRVKGMESRLGAALVIRDGTGRTVLTQLGKRLCDHAEKMERHAHAADAVIGSDRKLSGTVRVTAVPFLLNRLLAPRLAELSEAHPHLHFSLIPDTRNLSLTRREVDIALRFGAPLEGGDGVLAQRIGRVAFSVFTASAVPDVAPDDRPWLVYDPVSAHLPQAKWTQDLADRDGGGRSRLLMHDLDTVFETLVATPTRALLPVAVARHDPRLTELAPRPDAPEMTRDVWLLRNAGLRGIESIDATATWLTRTNLFQT